MREGPPLGEFDPKSCYLCFLSLISLLKLGAGEGSAGDVGQ
jgi:hypothetical protein